MRKALLLVMLLVLCLGGLVTPTQAWQASGGFLALLNRAPDAPASRTQVWYGALGDLEAVMGVTVNSFEDVNAIPSRQRRIYLLETGSQAYYSAYTGFDQSAEWQQQTGINSFAIDRELTAGTGSVRFGLLQGRFDQGAITAALTASGYQSGSASGVPTLTSPEPRRATLPALALVDDLLIVAPANQLGDVIAPGQTLGADPIYAATAAALDRATSGVLVSAVLFDPSYLNQTVFGGELSAALNAVRGQIGVDDLALPPYALAGVGYRFDGSQRYWVVALAYAEAGAAQAATAVIGERLTRYTSLFSPGPPLFEGWTPAVGVDDGLGVPVVVAVMPATANVAWAQTMRSVDVGFLATP